MPAENLEKITEDVAVAASPAVGVAPAEGSEEPRRRIEDEHRALRKVLSRVEGTWDLAALLPLLEELQGMLAHHFAEEENAERGLHAAIAASAPEKNRSLERLFEEHEELLEQIDRLVSSTRNCLEGVVDEILSGVAELTWRLRLHEEAESDLFVEVVSTDLGGSG